jgi:hypothetical protein
VLTQKSFVEWANENMVVLIAHNELGHDPIEAKGYDGQTVRTCPLYPGMTCRDHCDASVDIDTDRDEDLVPIPFIELCPNSWLVPAGGTPEAIAETDQFVPGKIKDLVKAMQKRLGKPLPARAYRQIVALFAAGDAAVEAEDWHKALTTYASIEALAKAPPASLTALVDARLAEVEDLARFAFEDAVEAEGADGVPVVRALVAALDVPVYGRTLPLLAEARTWLERRPGR